MKGHPGFKFGADVWWREPITGQDFSLEKPIFDLDHVLGTPHNADLVENMLAQAVAHAVANVVRHLKDEKLKVIGDPLIDEDKAKEIDWDTQNEFEFEYSVGLAPEIDINTKVKVTQYKIKVDDKEARFDILDKYANLFQHD